MQNLTRTEMKSVQGGIMNYMGCFDYNGGLFCCIECAGVHYCGGVQWYFEVDANPNVCM